MDQESRNWNIWKILGRVAICLSITGSLVLLYQRLTTAQVGRTPVWTELKIVRTQKEYSLSWTRIPSSAPILPGGLQNPGGFQTEPQNKIADKGQISPKKPRVPMPPIPPWISNFRAMEPSEGMGDAIPLEQPGAEKSRPNKPHAKALQKVNKPRAERDEPPLQETWRPCNVPNRPEICAMPPKARRNTVVEDY